MKKFVLLLTLIPMLSWAFPVHTNSYTFDPAQSTGSFDDFLFRWSGFDDQSVEFLFKDVTVSNVGFRLAYPQRGRTFLDVLPPKTTNTSVIVTNEVLDVYTNFYPAIYNRITDRGFTNITETLNYSNGIFLSRSVVTNSFKAGSVQNTTLGFVAANVVYTQNAAVANTEAYGPFTNAYVQSQNITITVSNFLENVLVGSTKINNTNYFYFNSTTLVGYNGAVVSGTAAVTNGYVFTRTTGGSTNFSFVAGETYLIIDNIYSVQGTSFQNELAVSLGASTNRYSIYGSAINSATVARPQTNLFVAPASGTATVYRTVTATTSNTSMVVYSSDIKVYTATITNLSQSVSTNTVTLAASNSVEYAFPSTQRVSKIYSKTITPYSKVTFSIPRTNIPPDGPYFSEVLTYTAGGITNPSQSRTLAKGQVTIENSIYSITNYAGYTNYPGPWSYLLQDGSRPMTGNLNLGGYSATNISTLVFTNGSSITIDDVATWNSFISSTSGLNAGTVFGGQVTGTYNNLNVRKDALDNMEYLDLTTSPTGAVAAGRAVWSTGRSTAQLGLNANVNLDVGQQLMLYAKNDDTNTLAKGEVVIVSGASGDNPTIKRASNTSEALSARTIGIMAESVAVNGSGFVVTRGTIYGLNTTNFTQGAGLYLGANGTLQTNLPVAPTHGVFVGTVERVHQNAGQIYVAIQNYNELEELSDVNVASRATNDFLIWNGTVWTNYARTNLALQSSLSGYLPLAGGTMSGNINMNGLGFTNVNIIQGEDSPSYINIPPTSQGEFVGPWTFLEQPTIPGYQTIDGSVNAANLTNLSAIAGSGLDVSAGKLVVTSSAANASTWSAYSATQMVDFASNNLNNVRYIQFSTNANDVASAAYRIGVSGTRLYFSDSPGGAREIWHAGNLTIGSYLTISQGNTNYWRITTAPAISTAAGSRGQIAVSSSNVFLYNPDALGSGTARWIRISGDINW